MTRAPHRASLPQLALRISLCAWTGVCLCCTAGNAAAQSPAQNAPPAHIAPSTMPPGSSSLETGNDTWAARGFDLKTLIAQIYDVDPRRVDLPGDTSTPARFDLTLNLPQDVDADTIQRLLAEALEKEFHIAITPATRPTDVYAITAPSGPGPSLHPHVPTRPAGIRRTAIDSAEPAPADAQQITYIGRQCPGISAGGISATAETIPDLRRTLEPILDRLLVDETRLTGSFDFAIGAYSNQQQLFNLLRSQLGLAVAPVRRNITVLAVTPAN